MKTQEAYNEYLLTAQANSDYLEFLAWSVFILLFLAPLIMFIIIVIVNHIEQRRK